MNNRTIYIMVIALMLGIMSASLAHRLVTAGKEEVLVPTRDLGPRMALKDPELFEKRYMSKEELTRGTPVLEHAEIKHRFSKNLILRKDQPIYLDDTTEDPARTEPAVPPVAGPAPDLPSKPLLGPGTIGLTMRIGEGEGLGDNVKVGENFELVLTRQVEKDGEMQVTKMVLLTAPVCAVHRHRPPGGTADSPGKLNALTFAMRVVDAQRVMEAMKTGIVVPVPLGGAAPAPAVDPRP